MKKRWKILIALLFCILLIIIALNDNMKYRSRFKNGIKVKGVAYSTSKNIIWKYKVNGSEFEGIISKSHYPYIENEEQYYIYYEHGNPSSSSISFVEPIIDTALFDSISCLPLYAKYEKGSQLVSFNFVVNSDTIKRYHRYKFTSNFESYGKRFVVYFKIKNPNISYINLEK